MKRASRRQSPINFPRDPGKPEITLGLRANLGQFSLLVLVNGFVGAMVGLERAVVPLIVAGMWVQAVAIWLVAASQSFGPWLAGATLLGLGTALVYPTLLAAVGDVAAPLWRASAVGVYRLWRDGGYALGALLAGLLADAFGLPWAIAAIGGLTFLSGLAVAGVMKETWPRPSRSP